MSAGNPTEPASSSDKCVSRKQLDSHPMSSPMIALCCCALLLASSCAFFEEENRRTLNAMDADLAPSSTAARWALAPVMLPAGALGLAADVLVVHPATAIDDAWADTVEWLWTPAEDESRFRRAVMVPLVTLATPLVFASDWLGRSLFALDPREEDS